MRLFYGIQLPEEIRETLADLILHLQSYIPTGIKWIEKENLHLTFQFIGEVQPTKLADLETCFLSSISSCESTNFKFEAIEVVPLKDPHLIWISLSSDKNDFSQAIKNLRNQLNQDGFNLDNKDFTPHITLGRIKNNLMKPQVDFILNTELNKEEFYINEIALFESNLTKRGAIYRILKTYNLQ